MSSEVARRPAAGQLTATIRGTDMEQVSAMMREKREQIAWFSEPEIEGGFIVIRCVLKGAPGGATFETDEPAPAEAPTGKRRKRRWTKRRVSWTAALALTAVFGLVVAAMVAVSWVTAHLAEVIAAGVFALVVMAALYSIPSGGGGVHHNNPGGC